jgi:hypothetical protein
MKNRNWVYLLALLLFATSFVKGQSERIVSSKIVGTWLNEEDPEDKYIFQANGSCIYYYEGSNKPFQYKYSITNDPSKCEPEIKKGPGDTTAYLRLFDLKDKSIMCFVINGITRKMLVLRSFGASAITVYVRKEGKN